MPSGKKSKQARRAAASAPPPVQSKGSPRRRQANPKVLAAVGAVVVLAIVGIVLGVTLSGGGSKSASDLPAVGSCATGLPGCTDVEAMFKGIPQKGTTLGSAFAPVTMIEYIDLQCPFCQEFETQVLPDVLTKYVRPGKVKIEMRPLDFIGPDSARGRDALLAAANQNKAFNFAEILYDNQKTENTGWLNDAMIGQAAASIPGLNVSQVMSERSSGSIKSQASDFDAQQTEDQVTGTPTIFLSKNDGKTKKQVALKSSTDEATLVAAINDQLSS